MVRLFLLCLLGVGAYGGFYGYCKYRVSDVKWAFTQTYQRLHNELIKRSAKVTEGDVRAVVKGFASKHKMEVVELHVTLKPLNKCNKARLPLLVRHGLDITDKMLAARKPPAGAGLGNLAPDKPEYWVAGFEGTFEARYKLARQTFTVERYTKLEAFEVQQSP